MACLASRCFGESSARSRRQMMAPGRRRTRGGELLLVALGLLFSAEAERALAQQPDPTVIVLVRHAEKEEGGDPGLTPAGQLRAIDLAETLAGSELDAVYSTQFRRTRQTAFPVAARLGFEERVFEVSGDIEGHAADLAQHLLSTHRGQAVLVVGHSNTLPEIVTALGGEPGPPIGEQEYDRIYLVILQPGHPARTVRTRYGVPHGIGRIGTAPERPFGTVQQQERLQQTWLSVRLRRVLPRLMREHGVDMWIVPMREYNEDPVFRALVSPTTMAARRRTIYVFCDGGEDDFERVAIGGTSQGGLYRVVRDPDARLGAAGASERRAEPFGPEQWQLLPPVVEECDPEIIAVNVSHTHAFSDGLSAGEWEQLSQALRPPYLARVVRRERLALDYMTERLPEMLPTYEKIMERAHTIIRTAFSGEVIEPGKTTTDDVVWWMRQRVNDLGLRVWFQPSVSVQRHGVTMSDSVSPVIQPGDVLHTDFGITAMGLNTDTQHMAYVLRRGEREAPAGLTRALEQGSRLQRIVLDETRVGRTGNQVLAAARERMAAEGIDGTVYTHPIGDHGHGAGPLIGLWDRQEGVPGRGDVPVRPNTWFSIELQATTPVPEWDGQRVRMALEEEAAIDEAGVIGWVLEAQDGLHLIRSVEGSAEQ